MPLDHLATLVIVALSITLMLARPGAIAEVWWVGSGALLLVATGLVSPKHALHAVGDGADVYCFLAGMMLLSEVAREFGVFEWLAASAVRGARGSCSRLFTTVYAVGAVVTVFMSNDATAVVLTPAILSAVKKAKVRPLPHLFVCALIANAASFVLPISNPANLVVFRGAMPPLGHWLAAFALPSLLSVAATYGVLRLYFRRELRGAIAHEVDEVPLSREGRGVLVGLGLVVVVLLVASAFDVDLGLPTLIAAALVTAVVCVRAKRPVRPMVNEISWSTLALVAALFVMVEAVYGVGALTLSQDLLAKVAALPEAAAPFVTGGVLGVANNVVNNLPLGLLAGATVRAAHPSALLTEAILLGVDLGPNLSVTGSLATLLWLLALRKEKVEVGVFAFLKVGALAMPIALLAAIAGTVALHALGAR